LCLTAKKVELFSKSSIFELSIVITGRWFELSWVCTTCRSLFEQNDVFNAIWTFWREEQRTYKTTWKYCTELVSVLTPGLLGQLGGGHARSQFLQFEFMNEFRKEYKHLYFFVKKNGGAINIDQRW